MIDKNLKLQMLTIMFKEIRMKDDEPFYYLCTKLNDIINSSFSLVRKFLELRLFEKFIDPYLRDLDIRSHLLKRAKT